MKRVKMLEIMYSRQNMHRIRIDLLLSNYSNEEIIAAAEQYCSEDYFAAEAIYNGCNYYFSNEADAIWFGLRFV